MRYAVHAQGFILEHVANQDARVTVETHEPTMDRKVLQRRARRQPGGGSPLKPMAAPHSLKTADALEPAKAFVSAALAGVASRQDAAAAAPQVRFAADELIQHPG